MLNAGYKKEALRACEEAGEGYKKVYSGVIIKSEELHKEKEKAVVILKDVDEYIHSLSNKPKEIQKLASEISIRRKAFEQMINELKIESKKVDSTSGSVVGAGALAGAGVAAFGPTAAMSIATTFGTASTGTAIATLTGAAQTSAALAWLGGGTVASGAAGMAGGQALLAMAGPVGWAIGGAALVGGGLLANSKNKKIAEKAYQQLREIKKETEELKEVGSKIDAEKRVIDPLNTGIKDTVSTLKKLPYQDYKQFTSNDKDMLMKLMNSSEALSKRIGVKIS